MPPLTEEVVIQRLTAVALMVGGVLTLASVLVSPRPEDPASVLSVATAYAESNTMARVGVVSGIVGIWSLVLGFANVHHFIGFGSGAAWGRLGFYALIIGAAGLTAAGGITLGAVDASAVWAGASLEGEFNGVEALILGAQNTVNLSTIAFWTALVFVGIAWTRTEIYPKWASWPLLLLGFVSTLLAVLRLMGYGGADIIYSLIEIVSGLVGIWALVAGAWLARRAW